jgi:hypothetical protein
MTKYSLDELIEAFERFSRVSDECAASGDYNAFADLFTEDCRYIEHVFGEMHGREPVRQWLRAAHEAASERPDDLHA